MKKNKNQNQQKKELKILIWILVFFALTGFSYTHQALKITQAQAPYEMQNNRLPINPDKENPSVMERIRIIAYQEGFRFPDYLSRLAYCESRYDLFALNANKDGTIDRGVFQINDYWHPDVSTAQAMDLEFATKWTIEKINAGYQHLWACDKLIK